MSDAGIASRRKRGAFAERWWAARWTFALEAVMDSGRLARGRRYARAGQVLSLREEEGRVVAEVLGSRRTRCRVAVGLTPPSDTVWRQVISTLLKRADIAAPLLAGEMPPDIDDCFGAANGSPFPTSAKPLQRSCSDADWVTVRQQITASCYPLGEQLDEDPLLSFRLRGRDQAAGIASLRERSQPGSLRERAVAVAGFRSAATPIPAQPSGASAPELALLRRLGPLPLAGDLIEALGPLYQAVVTGGSAMATAGGSDRASDS